MFKPIPIYKIHIHILIQILILFLSLLTFAAVSAFAQDAGDAVGTATLYRNGEAIRSVPIVAREAVDARGFTDYFEQAVSSFVHGIARGLCDCKNTWRIAAWLRAAHRNN